MAHLHPIVPESNEPLAHYNSNERLRTFHDTIRASELKGVNITRDEETGRAKFTDCTFFHFDVIKNYFQDTQNIALLLEKLHGDENLQVSPETIYAESLHLFCILLLIGRVHYMDEFNSQAIFDNKLPLEDLPTSMRHITTQDRTFWSDFEQQQRRFYPHWFRPHHLGTRWPPGTIFPISEHEPIYEYNGRSITKIVLHGMYNGLRRPIPNVTETQENDRNTFVIKSLDKMDAESFRSFENEVAALRALGCNGLDQSSNPPDEIIRSFGNFHHNNMCHILLEYADKGSLQSYLEKTPRPRTRGELVAFWNSSKAIVKGMGRIHNKTVKSGQQGFIQGYHQDLNLANILVFSCEASSAYEVKLKIADFGLTNLVGGQVLIPYVFGEGQAGTRTFGSPHNHRRRLLNNGTFINGQADDIWSLACILSIITTWTNGGWNWVNRFTECRRQARQKHGKSASDCFHDDVNVLDEVRRWHLLLANECDPVDEITPRIWDKLLSLAFLTEERRRPPALDIQMIMTGLLESSASVPQRSATMSDVPRTPSRKPTNPSMPKRGYSTDPAAPMVYSRRERLPFEIQETQQSTEITLAESPERESGDSDDLAGYKLHRSSGQASSSRVPRSPTISQTTSHQQSDSHNSIFTPSDPRSTRTSGVPDPDSPGRELHHKSGVLVVNDSIMSSMSAHRSHESQSSNNGKAKGKQRMDSTVHKEDCPLNPKVKPKIKDFLSVQDLYNWKETHDRRSFKEKFRGRDNFDNVPYSNCRLDLDGRDSVFLLDNSESMKKHWKRMSKLFGALAKFIKRLDPDGLEVYSTVGKYHKRSAKSSELVDEVGKMSKVLNCSSDPEATLRKIWNSHAAKFSTNSRSASSDSADYYKLTIYVLTDGVWRANTNLVEFIRELVKFLDDNKCEKDQVGIQFIQFGDSKEATDRLEFYDAGLKGTLSRDIVDREPADGNVWKMLLGSVSPYFDDDDDPSKCTCHSISMQYEEDPYK